MPEVEVAAVREVVSSFIGMACPDCQAERGWVLLRRLLPGLAAGVAGHLAVLVRYRPRLVAAGALGGLERLGSGSGRSLERSARSSSTVCGAAARRPAPRTTWSRICATDGCPAGAWARSSREAAKLASEQLVARSAPMTPSLGDDWATKPKPADFRLLRAFADRCRTHRRAGIFRDGEGAALVICRARRPPGKQEGRDACYARERPDDTARRCAAADKWRGPESNWRHHDFQSCALPTELPRRSSPLIVASALLDRPHVAVRVFEEAEPGSGRALRA